MKIEKIIASEMFGGHICSDHVADNALTARQAEACFIQHNERVSQAITILHELTFDVDENRRSKESIMAHVSCALAMLLLSDASSVAVEQFVTQQVAREWRDSRVKGADASLPAEHA